ncbi:hypothetical protein KYB31_15445 [Clostridium felsineum]|nr:hypothetical protein [Clostridium felsineum]MCR3760371.1 hypothetical protein [Clostridium felsineum]
MPNVTVIRPNITPEQEKKALEFFSTALGSLIEKKYGIEVRIETHRKTSK